MRRAFDLFGSEHSDLEWVVKRRRCWTLEEDINDGKIVAVANPNAKQLLGTDSRMLKEPSGKVYGQTLYDAAKDGQVNEVSYMFPKPGPDKTPVPKVSFVTRVGDLGCGVGYYK